MRRLTFLVFLFGSPFLYAQSGDSSSGVAPFFEKKPHHRSQPPFCHVDRKCLNLLHDVILNKEERKSLYSICRQAYKENRLLLVTLFIKPPPL